MKVRYAATVTLSSFVPASYAFQVTNPIRTQLIDVGRGHRIQHPHQTTRLYGTKSFIEQLGEVASTAKEKIKSALPIGKKEGLTKKDRAKQEVSSSIDTVLKDAPLGIRMVGKMMKPLVSKLAGNLAEAMEEQSRQMSELLADARVLIVQDSQAAQMLGEPIEVGTPFSQSSSTMNINGKTQSRTKSSFEVMGSRAIGTATMEAVNGKIENLYLNVSGRNIAIDTTKRAGSYSASFDDGAAWTSKDNSRATGLGKNRGKPDIIDAEFVDKKIDK